MCHIFRPFCPRPAQSIDAELDKRSRNLSRHPTFWTDWTICGVESVVAAAPRRCRGTSLRAGTQAVGLPATRA